MKRKKVQLKEIDGEKWYKFDKDYDRFFYQFGIFMQVFIVIFLLVMGGYMMYYITKHKELFYENPLVYGLDRINGEDKQCSCTLLNENGILVPFTFNDKEFIGVQNTGRDIGFTGINITGSDVEWG